MEEINSLFHGFAVIMTPMNFLLMVIGIVLGVLIGVLPGLGGANGVAILLPLTFSMSPTSAIIMLSCIYLGCVVRRCYYICPVQYSRGALVSRDDLRRLSDGTKRQCW